MLRLSLVLLFTLVQPIWAIPAEGHRMMISGPSPYAVEVGRAVAAQGGNVVDVAVAIGLTLSVTSPYFAALGGGGFALVKMGPEVEAIDFREMAPAATHRKYYLELPKGSSILGGHAVGVPGFPAGLYELHRKYGKRPWRALFTRPLELAENGFQISGEWAKKTENMKKDFTGPARKFFFKPDGSAYKPGELFKQPKLAQALRLLRDKPVAGFYDGVVAEDIIKSVHKAGGRMTTADLKNYKVRWLKPLATNYKGYELHLMPPPSSGGVVVIGALKLIEQLKVEEKPALSIDEFHLLGEIQARAFRGRALLGDPDFHKNPVERLTSNEYLSSLAKEVRLNKAVALKPLSDKEIKESVETTHFSVMDSEGRAVALTVTLNENYGSGVVSERFGIALNNEMDDFTTRPGEPNLFGLVQGPANEVEPGKRPLSSMSPTLVLKDGKVVMAIGAPGGPRIISGVLQAIYRILGRGTDIDLAVQAPRVHHQFQPNTLYVDKDRFSPEVLKGLRERGHTIEESWMGRVYVVRARPDGVLEAAYDSRGEGSAGGW